jgi:hypothetical protein
MLKTIFTLDYEIHGNGTGNPYALMVEPTGRLLRQFDAYGAKLTIMADIGEILKFKQFAEERGTDDYHYEAIARQLRDAVRDGHDVQLHIHSSYFNARHENGRWAQDWSEYDFARLSRERMNEMIGRGKEFLETLLRPVDPNYRCNVFRAANWSVCPSSNVINALVNNGIRIDTSIFKYGRREGRVNFDYTTAFSALVPWRADNNDICIQNDSGELWEFPIYSEQRWVGAFLTPQRIYRAYLSRLHKFGESTDSGRAKQVNSSRPRDFPNGHWLTRKHAWKADFNQCSGRQLISALERAEEKYGIENAELPFVLIGHSKLFTPLNQRSLRPFLAYIANRPDRFSFGRFSDFPLNRHGKIYRDNNRRIKANSCPD